MSPRLSLIRQVTVIIKIKGWKLRSGGLNAFHCTPIADYVLTTCDVSTMMATTYLHEDLIAALNGQVELSFNDGARELDLATCANDQAITRNFEYDSVNRVKVTWPMDDCNTEFTFNDITETLDFS